MCREKQHFFGDISERRAERSSFPLLSHSPSSAFSFPDRLDAVLTIFSDLSRFRKFLSRHALWSLIHNIVLAVSSSLIQVMASKALRGASGGTAPQSVESITRIAQNYEYNSSVPLRYWLRTAATLLREVGYTCCLHLGHDYFQAPC
jgi:hypothetical protein